MRRLCFLCQRVVSSGGTVVTADASAPWTVLLTQITPLLVPAKPLHFSASRVLWGRVQSLSLEVWENYLLWEQPSASKEGSVWINTVAPPLSKGYIWGLFTRFLTESSEDRSPTAKSGNLSYTPAVSSSSSPHFLLSGITSLYPRLSMRFCFMEKSNVSKSRVNTIPIFLSQGQKKKKKSYNEDLV